MAFVRDLTVHLIKSIFRDCTNERAVNRQT